MTLGVWLGIISMLIVFFPSLLFLNKYEERCDDSAFQEKFPAFRVAETAWVILNIGGFLWVLISNGSFDKFVLMAILLSSLVTPAALFSGLTGIYPVRSRSGYCYYEKHKDARKQFLGLSKYPTLKAIGWTQFCLLVIIILISFLML